MGPKVDFNLISHTSLFCILHKAYLVVHSSEFIFSYFSPSIVGIQASFEPETNQAALPKDGSITATCSPEIEQEKWFARGCILAQKVSIMSS
jgi:hypothetical protein